MAKHGKDRQLLANEMSFLLSQSNTFSVAFRIKRNRAQQWQFLGLALDLENEGLISYSELLNSERIKTIVETGRRSYNVHYWAKQFIRGFANDDGPFVELVHRKGNAIRPRLEMLKLNDNYTHTASNYLTEFASKNCPDLAKNVKRLTETKARQLFKEMFQFQVQQYMPHWGALAEAISEVAAKNGDVTANIPQALISGTNWVVLFLFFRSHVTSDPKQWDTIDINKEATDVLRFVRTRRDNGMSQDVQRAQRWTHRAQDKSQCTLVLFFQYGI